MEKEFDVVKIIKSLRNIKIFLKNEKLDKETKILLQNQKGNVIDIDSPPSSSESDINSDYSKEHKEKTKLNDVHSN